jgi:hypothetical protein
MSSKISPCKISDVTHISSPEYYSLNEESGYNRALEFFNRNREKPWNEWLQLETIFSGTGKQGLVGLFRGKDTEILYVFKISQTINYLPQHEGVVMNSLIPIADYCPYFCRVYGVIFCKVNPERRKDGNPFDTENAPRVIEKEVLLMEYIEKSHKLSSYIKSSRVNEKLIFSVIKQTLLGLCIAQKTAQLSHYDLHSNNIMVKSCSRDLVFLYIIDEENQFCVPSYGKYPVIIDYGFSYAKNLENEYLWPSMNHTQIGFISDRFDPVTDPKLFLVTIAGEMRESNIPKNISKKFWKMIKKNYESLDIDWGSGWDSDEKKCANDYVISYILEGNSNISRIFSKYEFYCLDIVQTLILLPLQKQDYTESRIAYRAFLEEFAKIENEISSPFYCLYILKCIVDYARILRVDYTHKQTREQAVKLFSIHVYNVVRSVAKFCQLKNLHAEKMLCSLYCFTKGVEGILYEAMQKRMRKKRKMYEKIPLKSPEELFCNIDVEIPSEYIFSPNTRILVVDMIREKCYPMDLSPEQQGEINMYESISRGMELYKILQKNK